MGGDEFVVVPDVQPRTPCSSRRECATPFASDVVDHRELFVSTSMGVCLYPGDGDDAEGLFEERRHGHVPRQGAGPRPRRALRAGDGRRRARAAGARERAPARRREGRAPSISRSSESRTADHAGWKRCCGGATLCSGCCIRPNSSAWPRPQVRSCRWASGRCEACRRCSSGAIAATALRVAINLSVRQLQQPDFVDVVRIVLDETGLPADRPSSSRSPRASRCGQAAARSKPARAKAQGVRVSIDDFGTGYSSLGALRYFPVDSLKIDRSFVSGVPHNTDDSAIAAAVITLGQKLGVNVIAEGIERPEQLAFFRPAVRGVAGLSARQAAHAGAMCRSAVQRGLCCGAGARGSHSRCALIRPVGRKVGISCGVVSSDGLTGWPPCWNVPPSEV